MATADHDLHYRPPESGVDWPRALGAVACLVIGPPDAEEARALSALYEECRTASTGLARHLHSGTYAVRLEDDEKWRSVVVRAGQLPATAQSATLRFTEDNHLTFARDLWVELWAKAAPLAGDARFAVGDLVRIVGSDDVGRIRSFRRTDPYTSYEVTVDGVNRRVLEGSLERIDGDPRDPEFWLRQEPASAQALALTLTWTKLSHPLTDTLYSFASSKTVFRPYQFKPVLKVLNSAVGRVLIADEVGLGKTIEAGLIWNELEHRETVRRALVVAPANLTLKWQDEMSRRFDRKLQALKPTDLVALAEQLAAGADPEIAGVISLQALRVANDALADLEKVHPRFDLVIVDEAHNLRNRDTKSFALGKLLSDWSDYLVFLTATPINLHNQDLFNLLNLLDEDHFLDPLVFEAQTEPNEVLNAIAKRLTDGATSNPRSLLAELDQLSQSAFGADVAARPEFLRLKGLLSRDRLSAAAISDVRGHLAELNTLSSVLTRTRKADVPDSKAIREPVNIDVEWTDAERAFYDAVYAHYLAVAQARGGFALGMQMPLRQAASCIPAMQQVLREQLGGTPTTDQVDDVDDIDEDGADPPLPIAATLLKPLPVDTKFAMLDDKLHAARDAGIKQFMIFSFFRRTLSYLAERLRGQFRVAMMHGGVPMDERQKIMEDFRRGRYEILLLSEVGSEGLDFEFCNVLVNYDMPWNPMRVEQRIGRLDRFGQEHEKIFIYNMRVPGTIETDIFQRLYDRIRIFEGSVGELEPILREEIGKITKRLLNPRLTSDEKRREIDRVAVAVENHARDLQAIDESRALLSGLDNLLVSGLGEDGPRAGRFVGAAELRSVLSELFRRYPGKLAHGQLEGTFALTGSPALAAELRRLPPPHRGSRFSQSHLAMLLQDEQPIAVTFEPEIASRHNVELITSRHPLIRLGLRLFGADDLALRRFGALAVPGIGAGCQYFVTFDLADTGGLRPRLELWTTALDLRTQLFDDEVGDLVLEALARGDLKQLAEVPRIDLGRLWRRAQDEVARRQGDEEARRRVENEALIDARIRAHQSSHQIKIDRVRELVAQLERDGKDGSIIRMHQSRIRNLTQLQNDVADRINAKRSLTLSVTPVAVAVVSSAL